ncbi:MAG: phosphatidylglycerol lysyltransferase domain-containing protein [Kofleriaceae bacterium]
MSEHERALAILRRHGSDTVSSQILESGFCYWFDEDAMVGYVDTGRAWVAAGGPLAPEARRGELARRFADAARASGRRACFFGTEGAACDLRSIPIGEQPVWDVEQWEGVLARSQSLRYQLRRATRSGVAVRVLAQDERLDPDHPVRCAIDRLLLRWVASRRMAEMRFLVQLEPFTIPLDRVLLIATRGDEVVGFLSAVPVFARSRLFVEDLVRDPGAPNGTLELLIDLAMRRAKVRGHAEVTLGLAPLTGAVTGWLRFARAVSAPLYDFHGLRAFKAKFRPHAWEPVYLSTPPGHSPLLAIKDSLTAFAGGSLIAFATRTALRPRHRAWAIGGTLALIAAAIALVWLVR